LTKFVLKNLRNKSHLIYTYKATTSSDQLQKYRLIREMTVWNTSEYNPVTNPSTASEPDTASAAEPVSLSGVNLHITTTELSATEQA